MLDQEREARLNLLTSDLPAAVRRAVDAYAAFSETEAPTEAKEFTAFQNACKSAIGHLTALFQFQKLVAAVLAPKDEAAPREDPFADVYERAKRTLDAMDDADED
jgi:hypothetical protein